MALSQEPPEGIQLHLNYDDLTDIQATIVGPGKFRFSKFHSGHGKVVHFRQNFPVSL